ncbi:MAG: hypothetical protein JWN96_292 [Mycobacterium sp.]|nr:hypothetical protein [Mycobacterium sp.]
MALSIGTLVGYLQLDDTNFNRKADTADRKMSALKLHLEALSKSNPKIQVQVDTETAKLDALKLKMTDLKAQAAAGVDVRVDIVQAMVELDAVQAKVRELHNAEIRVNVKGAEKAKADLAGINSGFGALVTGALALGPALIPVTAAVGGLVAILASPILAAGGGLAIFGVVAAKAVSETNKQQKAIEAAGKKVQAAKAALAAADASATRQQAASNAAAQRSQSAKDLAAQRSAAAKIAAAGLAANGAFTPAKNAALGSKISSANAGLSNSRASAAATAANSQASAAASAANKRAAAQAKLTAATAAYNAAQGKLSPQQKKFLDSEAKVRSSFHSLATAAGPAVFGPLTSGMNLLAQIMPKLAPVLNAVSGALQHILDNVSKSAKDGGLDKVTGFFTKFSGPAIVGIASILGNITKGFVAIGIAFAPMSGTLLSNLDKWSAKFANIGSSQGLHDFVDYVHKEGPVVASTVGSVARAIGHIVKALAPLGGVALKAIGKFADGISKIPSKVLTAAAIALAGIAVSVKAISLAKGGLSALSKIPGLNSLSGGLLGKVASKAAPIPVFVTNEGFGGAPGTGAGDGAGAGGKAKGLAVTGSVTAVLAYLSGKEAFNNLDSLKRSSGVPDHVSGSVQKIYDTLAKSNIGKYADEFHINLMKLATDLSKFGSKGAYVQQVQKTLDPPGIGTFLGAEAGAFPGVNTKAERGSAAVNDLVDLTKARDKDIASLKSQADLTKLLLIPTMTNYGKATGHLRAEIAALHDKTVAIKVNLALPKGQQLTAVNNASHAVAVRLDGARATGGPVAIGRSYRVGERGPEVFTPDQPGYITPNGGSPAGGGRPGGPTFIFNGDMRPNDYQDLMNQVQARAKRTALDGVRRS